MVVMRREHHHNINVSMRPTTVRNSGDKHHAGQPTAALFCSHLSNGTICFDFKKSIYRYKVPLVFSCAFSAIGEGSKLELE